jgi:hypothetical protein
MYSRDYILKLVQQLAQVVAKLAGLKDNGDLVKASEVLSDAYKEMIGIERVQLIELDESDMITILSVQYHLSHDQLEVLARLLYEDALLVVDGKKVFYRKSLSILEYLNKEQRLYSFERENLMNMIRKNLN